MTTPIKKGQATRGRSPQSMITRGCRFTPQQSAFISTKPADYLRSLVQADMDAHAKKSEVQ